MDDICYYNVFPEPTFPYSIVIVHPYELRKEDILQDNLKHVVSDFRELYRVEEQITVELETLRHLPFDSQKEKQNQVIRELNLKSANIRKKMNEGLSPYRWKVIKNVNSYEFNIRADYGLVLIKD